LQNKVRNLFEYISPSTDNIETYSEQIGILLTIACFEIESNMTAILRENGYIKYDKNHKLTDNLTMEDYKKIEKSHRLSDYIVRFPEWVGSSEFQPFSNWKNGQSLLWYTAYNKYKHDRVNNAKYATFLNLMEAYSANYILLSAQFGLDGFSVEKETIGFAHQPAIDGFEQGVGNYLYVKFPTNWPVIERYDFQLDEFNWRDPNFCKNYPY
jgi:hypothetical protein